MGHSCCTALAVMGGRYISTKISVKHGTYACTEFVCFLWANYVPNAVTLAASALFLLFGVVYLYEAFVDPETSDFHPISVS